MNVYLRMGGIPLRDAIHCPSIRQAKQDFLATAQGLSRYGQSLDASIHIASREGNLKEYPDYVLGLGPRGGLQTIRV